MVAPQPGLTGSKLPSNEEVLSVIAFHINPPTVNTHEACKIATDMVIHRWNMARIPTTQDYNILKKAEKLYGQFKECRRASQKAKLDTFYGTLKKLFDIAHHNAMKMITNEEDRAFLIAQREPGRRGYMSGIDRTLAAKEKRNAQRLERSGSRSEPQPSTSMTVGNSSGSLDSSDEAAGSSDVADSDSEDGGKDTVRDGDQEGETKQQRSRRSVITPGLASALDRTNLSDRKAVFVLTEAARALGHDINVLAINRSTIRRQRRKYRAEQAMLLKTAYRPSGPLVVHWDGKMMEDLTGNGHVDRLPVLVSGGGTSQLLKVAKLDNATGRSSASAVVAALEEWGVADQVAGMAFDTTSSNTGRHSGACVLVEQELEKDLLYLACRHHIHELLAQVAFKVALGPSSGPEVPLFKRFQTQWNSINQDKYNTGVADPDVASLLVDVKEEMVAWAKLTLQDQSNLRDDYQELVELVLIFLGGTPSRGVHFRAPGPMHQARWMAKMIYALKMWMFRGQLNLTKREERGLRRISVFAARIYVKFWIEAPLAAKAPLNDLCLLKALCTYGETAADEELGETVLQKLNNHLWYLSEEMVPLALFDKRVPAETKTRMVHAMKQSPDADGEAPAKRASVPPNAIPVCQLEDFASERSHGLFSKLQMDSTFLDTNPSIWPDRDDYKNAADCIQGLMVTNDHAERGVALIKEYNRSLTKEEEQLQFLLQVVSEHRRQFPNSLKRTLADADQEE